MFIALYAVAVIVGWRIGRRLGIALLVVGIVVGVALVPWYLSLRGQALGAERQLAARPGAHRQRPATARAPGPRPAGCSSTSRSSGRATAPTASCPSQFGDPVLNAPHNEWLRFFAEHGVLVGLLGLAFAGRHGDPPGAGARAGSGPGCSASFLSLVHRGDVQQRLPVQPGDDPGDGDGRDRPRAVEATADASGPRGCLRGRNAGWRSVCSPSRSGLGGRRRVERLPDLELDRRGHRLPPRRRLHDAGRRLAGRGAVRRPAQLLRRALPDGLRRAGRAARRLVRPRPERRLVGARAALAARVLVDRAAASGPGGRSRSRCSCCWPSTAAPFTNRVLVWVDSPLASAQNGFPVYPRDLALVFLVVGGRVHAVAPRAGHGSSGSALALGGIVLVHLQIALLAAWLLGVWALVQAIRGRTPRPIVELAGAGAHRPRDQRLVVAAAGGRDHRVRGAPARRVPGGAAAASRAGRCGHGVRRRRDLRAARAGRDGGPPAAPGSPRALPGLDRGVPAARRRRSARGRVGPRLGAADLAAGLDPADRGRRGDPEPDRVAAALGDRGRWPSWRSSSCASVPGTVASVRLVRDAWEPGRAGGRVFDATAWDPIFSDLTSRVRADGHHVAITYDAYEAWVWSFSGAQVPSLWLPGPFKLGFDPERLTGDLVPRPAARPGDRVRRRAARDLRLHARPSTAARSSSTSRTGWSACTTRRPRRRTGSTRATEARTTIAARSRGRHHVRRSRRIRRPPHDARQQLAADVPRPRGATPGGRDRRPGARRPDRRREPTTAPLIEIDTGTGAGVTFGQGLEPGWARVVVPVDGRRRRRDDPRRSPTSTCCGSLPSSRCPASRCRSTRARSASTRPRCARRHDRARPRRRSLGAGHRRLRRVAGAARRPAGRPAGRRRAGRSSRGSILAVVISQMLVAGDRRRPRRARAVLRRGASPSSPSCPRGHEPADRGRAGSASRDPSSGPSAGPRRSRCPGRPPSAGPAGRPRTRSSGTTPGSAPSSRPPAASRPSVAEWGRAVRWLPDYLVFNIDSQAYLSALVVPAPGGCARGLARAGHAARGPPALRRPPAVGRAARRARSGRRSSPARPSISPSSTPTSPRRSGSCSGSRRCGSWSAACAAAAGRGCCSAAPASGIGPVRPRDRRDRDGAAGRGVRGRRMDRRPRPAHGARRVAGPRGAPRAPDQRRHGRSALQGRAAAAGGALNPGTAHRVRTRPGRSSCAAPGYFTVPEPPPPARPLAGGVTSPWAGLRLTSAFGWWLIPFGAIGALFLAGLGGRRARGGRGWDSSGRGGPRRGRDRVLRARLRHVCPALDRPRPFRPVPAAAGRDGRDVRARGLPAALVVAGGGPDPADPRRSSRPSSGSSGWCPSRRPATPPSSGSRPTAEAALEALRTTGSSGDVVLCERADDRHDRVVHRSRGPARGTPAADRGRRVPRSRRTSSCSTPTSGSSSRRSGRCSIGSGSAGSSWSTIRPCSGRPARSAAASARSRRPRADARLVGAGIALFEVPAAGDRQRRHRRPPAGRERARSAVVIGVGRRPRGPAGRAVAASPPRRRRTCPRASPAGPRRRRPGGATLAEHADQPPAPRRTGLRPRARARGDRAAPTPRRRQPGPRDRAARRRARPLRRRAVPGPRPPDPGRARPVGRAARATRHRPRRSRSRSRTSCCSTRSGGPIAPTSGSAGSCVRCRRPSSRRPRGETWGGVLVCIPALDEAESLPAVLAEIPTEVAGLATHVLVIDDGSRDGTADVARAKGAHVVSHPVNSGQGAALQTGYLVAERLGVDVVVTLDADGQHDPAQMERLVEPIVRDEADFVVGSRRMAEGESADASKARDAGITVYTRLINLHRRHRGQRHRQRLPRDPGVAPGRDRVHRGPVPQPGAAARRGAGRPAGRRRAGHHPPADGRQLEEGDRPALRPRVPAGDAQDVAALRATSAYTSARVSSRSRWSVASRRPRGSPSRRRRSCRALGRTNECPGPLDDGRDVEQLREPARTWSIATLRPDATLKMPPPAAICRSRAPRAGADRRRRRRGHR